MFQKKFKLYKQWSATVTKIGTLGKEILQRIFQIHDQNL